MLEFVEVKVLRIYFDFNSLFPLELRCLGGLSLLFRHQSCLKLS
jgi:hypothetical protein